MFPLLAGTETNRDLGFNQETKGGKNKGKRND